MKRTALTIAACTLLLTAGCQELPSEQPADGTHTTADAAAGTVQTASEPVLTASTICDAYAQQLSRIQRDLQGTPEDAETQEVAEALEVIIANTCS